MSIKGLNHDYGTVEKLKLSEVVSQIFGLNIKDFQI